ncbi:MAG: efflux RND transporter periplasmic adaptor subunit [Chromatiales bacterium]|jgi:multidrug efflux pump subunit AcrA (membrane-fusion protein)
MRITIQALALAAAILAGAAAPAQAQPPQPSAGGDWFTVQQARGAPTVSLGGTVVPYKEVTLAAQLPGRVEFLAGKEGDTFKEGDELVAIDDSELRAKRQAAVAQLANADAQLRNAGVQYTRELWSPRSRSSPGGMGIPNLFDQMFTRPMEDFTGDRDRGAERYADIYSSNIQIQQARNSMMQARSEIAAIDAKLRDARSVAPFDGVITEKYIEVGDTVQPGQPLLDYSDVEYLQVLVDVPARLRPGLSEGMMLQAELDVGDAIVPIRVAQIYPMADPQRHTVKVKFDLPQGVSAPGMYAEVMVPDFNAPTREHPVIPLSAIRYNGSLPGVYVRGGDGEPQLRLIRVGETLGGGFVTVLSGLRPGEQILRDPSARVTSGWGSSQRGGAEQR